jgi:hypothetical protein
MNVHKRRPHLRNTRAECSNDHTHAVENLLMRGDGSCDSRQTFFLAAFQHNISKVFLLNERFRPF